MYLNFLDQWFDVGGKLNPHLFEVKVKASNGQFMGEANCYTNRDEIKKLSKLINGFPKRGDQIEEFSTQNSNDSFSYFNLKLECINPTGKSVARIKIATIIEDSQIRSDRGSAEFDVFVEANSINEFSRALMKVSKAKVGSVTAVLTGKEKNA